jgi:hypothetical protein
MEIVKPSAGNLFEASAIATKKLEHLAFTLGAMVDIVREITTRPLTASDRERAIEAFKRLDGLDPWARALDQVRVRLKNFADDLDH